MKIVVNTRLLQHNKLEGIGRFMFETLSRITSNHPEHHFYFIFDRPFHESFIFSDNVTPIIAGPPARHPFLFVYWFEFVICDLLNRLKADLFLSCDGYLSLRSSVKQVAVIHDINFHHFPNDLPWLVEKYYNYYFPRFARKANRIVTVSEFSKNDIAKSYNIEPSHIDVVYNGCSAGFRPVDTTVKNKVMNERSLGMPYFLYVGSIHPRKNLQRLFKAYDSFKKKSKAPHKLLIAGQAYFWNREMKKSLNDCEYKDEIIFLGRVEEKELHKITASAFALVYVPVFEGFGIPVLEAMNCDVPVITSNLSSLPEVAGNAALLSNPLDEQDIAQAMINLYENKALAADIVKKGQEQREKFSWDKTAELLWNSCDKVLKV